MKKKGLVIITAIALLTLVAVGACGGDNGEKETTAPTTTAPQTTQPSNGGSSGLTWNDMPVYGGADQIQKGSWSIPADEGDYSKVEWRYYETGDEIGDVIDFYKDRMPNNGWDEVMWMDMEDVAWGMYMKNNEKDAAYVWMMTEEGDTVIALMRATE